MDVEFSGKIWQWRGPAPYYFVTVPEKESRDLRTKASGLSYGWGGLRVTARVGDTEWDTSLTSKDGRYVLPLRDLLRLAEGLGDNDTITVRLSLGTPTVEPQRPRPSPRPDGRDGAEHSRKSLDTRDDRFRIIPANEATWEDLLAVFGAQGDRSRCWCQRFKMRPKESWASVGAEKLAHRFRQQTGCGHPESNTTSGLVAYLDGDPVGWCAVEPRPVYLRMLRNNRVPWEGRTEDKADDSVWAVTCFITRTGFRSRGVSSALARAAVDFARQRGARALEGYPDLVERGNHVGARSVFAAAGLVEVSRPTNRRAVMRIDFSRRRWG